MKRISTIRGVLLVLAVLGSCLPQPLLAAPAATEAVPQVTDVALGDGGLLLGQVVDPQGKAQASAPVTVSDQNGQVAAAATDPNGYFAVRGLRGGVYQISSTETRGMFRLWAPRTAPPTAQQGTLLVTGQETVRGQLLPCCGGARFWLSNPCVLGAVVATAVAVPVVIASQHHEHKPVSP